MAVYKYDDFEHMHTDTSNSGSAYVSGLIYDPNNPRVIYWYSASNTDNLRIWDYSISPFTPSSSKSLSKHTIGVLGVVF